MERPSGLNFKKVWPRERLATSMHLWSDAARDAAGAQWRCSHSAVLIDRSVGGRDVEEHKERAYVQADHPGRRTAEQDPQGKRRNFRENLMDELSMY